MDEEKVKKIIADEFSKLYQRHFRANYFSGNPLVPPHTHNGVDNLPIKSSGGGGTPANPDKSVQFNNSGAFGGDATFLFDKVNEILAVYTINSSLDNNNTSDLTIDSVFGTSLFLGTIDDPSSPSVSGNIDIATGDSNGSGNITMHTGAGSVAKSGNITIKTGAGNSLTNEGKIVINTGGITPANLGNGSIAMAARKSFELDVTTNSITFQSNAGDGSGEGITASGDFIFLQGQSSGVLIRSQNFSSGTTGALILKTGDANSGQTSGDINIVTGTSNTASGSVNIAVGAGGGSQGDINIISGGKVTIEGDDHDNSTDGINLVTSGSLNFELAGQISNPNGSNIFIYSSSLAGAGGGKGIISIENANTNPTSNPVGGGILYVSAGALVYRGSGGTVTTIAVA